MDWFRRLAEVPGVYYEGSSSIDRSKLGGHDSEPTVNEFEFGGEVHRSPHWPTPEGSTSASPVHRRAFAARDAASPRAELRRLEETLELPGELSDYHFAFATKSGTIINPSNLRNRSFKPLLGCAGLRPIRFHDLRHTCATLLLSSNVNPKVVSELLGHSSVAITLDTYSHVLPTMQRNAVRALEDALK